MAIIQLSGLRSGIADLRPCKLTKPHRPPHFKKDSRILAMPLPYARLAEELSFDPLSTPECSFDSLSELEYQKLAISYRAVPGFQCPELVPPSVMAAEEDEVQYLGSVCAGSASDDEVQYLGSVSAPRVRGSAGSSGFVVTIEVVVVMDNLYNSDLGAIQFFRPFPLLT